MHLDVNGTPGDLAVRAWDLLDVDGDVPVEDLDDAIELLGAALDHGPDDPDVPVWQYWLASAHGARAGADGTGDLDRAREWLGRVVRGPGHPWLETDGPAADLALLHIRRHGMEPDRYDFLAVVADLDALPVRDPDSSCGQVAAFYQRLARLQRAMLHDGGPQHDPERFTDDLQDLLPHLPDDLPLLPEALLLHAEACDGIRRFTAGLISLERIRTLPDAEVEPRELDVLEGTLHYGRWSADDPTVDLVAERDASITCLRRAAAVGPLPSFADLMLGELLTHRGDERDDAEDLAAGSRHLREVVAGDGPDPGDLWLMIGMAHQRRWVLLGDDEDRDLTVEAIDQALHHGIDDDQLLMAHALRAAAVVSASSDGRAADPARSRELLDTGHDALVRAGSSADPEDRALLAGQLVTLQISLGVDDSTAVVPDRVAQYLRIARSHPEPPADWLDALDEAAATLDLLNRTVDPRRDGSGVEPVLPLMGRPGGRVDLGVLAAIGLLGRGARTGDRGPLQAARAVLDGDETAHARLIRAWIELGLAHSAGADGPALQDAWRHLLRCTEDAAADPEDRWARESLLPLVRAMNAIVNGGTADVTSFDRAASGSITAVVHAITSVFTRLVGIVGEHVDPRTRDASIVDALRRADALPTGSIERMAADGMLAAVMNAAIVGTGRDDPALTEEALRRADAALSALDGPRHPLWSQTALTAAAARRRRDGAGDRAAGRALGISALRARAWLVLLQAGTADAMALARSAGAEAQRVVRWCLEDRHLDAGALDDLVVALEAGRALVLFATTTVRSVRDRLAALGEDVLAREWEHAGGADRLDLGAIAPDVQPHGDLRQRVLDALSTGSDLLDPPNTDEIRDVLRRHGSDVLVHLVADPGRPGHAVFVPARGDVEVVELPELRIGDGTQIAHYAAAFARWHGPDPGSPQERRAAFEHWRDALGALAGWAWEAAGRAVLEKATRFAADPALPCLALAPVGQLALVPWQAARPAGGGRTTALAARAVVSWVPSARLLEHALDRTPGGTAAALVVGDPTGDLRSAGAEAHAVHDVFHPGATYLGRAPVGATRPTAGPGSAADVLTWLEAQPTGATLVHLACHAIADLADPPRSHLRLADGPLAVADLLAHQVTHRLPLDHVVLSACATNVGGEDHDEAFSLSTTFLAAGARTVVGSMWTVPDAYTSRLIFMYHHYLETDRCRPADALHRAQCWALDPGRIAPATMPARLVAARGGLPPDDPVAWAGFVHLGV